MISKLACLPLALILAGCISTAPYQPPTSTTPTQWKNSALLDPAQKQNIDLARWWQSFNDPVLNSLINTALAQNLDIKSAQAKLREARARARITDAALYPSVTSSVLSKVSESGSDANTSQTLDAGFDASWELDLFGGLRYANQASIATASASESSLRDTHVSLIAEVATTYISLRTLEARYAAAQGSLASQQETRDLTRWRWQAGLVSELDFIQSESTLAQTRAKLPALDIQIESARNQLAVLLGVQVANLPDLRAGAGKIPEFTDLASIPLPLETLRQRPDIRNAERNLAAQTAKLNAADAARYPSLNLSASISLQADQLHNLLRADALLSSLTANLTAPIFNAGSIRANIDTQDALLEQSLASYQKTVLQAVADVENGLMSLTRSQLRSRDLRSANSSALAAETMARQRYTSGLTDYLTVLDTQRTLLSVQDSLSSAEGDRASALVQLYKALGGGWNSAEASITRNQAGEARHD